MSLTTFVEAQHAACIAVAGMALRALLASAAEADPEVVALVVEVADGGSWQSPVVVEMRDQHGNAVGGYTL